MKSRFFFVVCFGLISSNLFSQVVNIESKRMHTDSVRFVLKNDLTFSYNNNDGKYIFQISDGLATQYKSKDLRKIYFLIGNYDLIRTADVDYRNSWFLHARFNYKITNLFRVESFIQSQYDALMDVNTRNLLGAGIRLKVVSKENLKIYLGNSYMFEEEGSDSFPQNEYNHRNSSYISITAQHPKNKIVLINTAYFQPQYSNFSDFRILEQLKLEFPITKKVNIISLFNYYYDSVTPKNRSQYYSNIKFGIGLKL